MAGGSGGFTLLVAEKAFTFVHGEYMAQRMSSERRSHNAIFGPKGRSEFFERELTERGTIFIVIVRWLSSGLEWKHITVFFFLEMRGSDLEFIQSMSTEGIVQ